MAELSGFVKVGETVHVPDNPRARLMFYFYCVASCLDVDKKRNKEIKELTDYKNFKHLSKESRRKLTLLCNMYSPAVLKGKCFFHDEKLSGGKNEFFKPKEVTRFGFEVERTKTVKIGDQEMEIKEIMVYGKEWIIKYWENPIKEIVEYDKAY